MKALVAGIKRMEIHDGNGLRTTVFFKGCPLKCIWCHNPECISYHKQVALFTDKCIGCGSCQKVCSVKAVALQGTHAVMDFAKCTGCFACADVCPVSAIVAYGQTYTVDELLDTLLQDEPFFRNGNGGVTLSGGECLSHPDFVVKLAKELFNKHISVNIDTCGHVTQAVLREIAPYVDTFLYDIKAILPQTHLACTGQDNQRILDNFRYLYESGCRIEVRYPLVKGYNDSECERIGAYLKDFHGITGIKVLPYHALAASRYEALGMENTLPQAITTDRDVQQAVSRLKSFGLPAFVG